MTLLPDGSRFHRRQVKSMRSFINIVLAIIAGGVPSSSAPLTVIVYDYAGVKDADLRHAEQQAARILGQTIAWLHCSEAEDKLCGQTAGPAALVIQLLPERATRRNGSAGAMGFAIPPADGGFGQHCGVFYDRVKQLSRQSLSEADVLGHAMAHELGHLLLGINAHSSLGLMSADWTSRELALAAQGKLLLRDAELRRIQENIANRFAAIR
jgi:hypothetical protein